MKDSLLYLIKIDAELLMKKIIDRREEYLMILSLKRTRDHFSDIFYTKFHGLSLGELKDYSQKFNTALFDFHEQANELKWYLMHSEDQPSAMNNTVSLLLKKLNKSYGTLNFHLSSESES